MSRYKPYPQYKDSGVKWLGVIPEKWTHVPLKYISFIKTGFAFNSLDFSSVGIPVLRIGDIKNDGEIDFSNAKYISSKFLETNEDDYVYKNLDEFLSTICDLLTKTSEELTKTYFSHYNE